MNDSLYKYLSEPLYKFEIVMHFGMFCTFAAERLKREENQEEKKSFELMINSKDANKGHDKTTNCAL